MPVRQRWRIWIVPVGLEVYLNGIIRPTGQNAFVLREWPGIKIVRDVLMPVRQRWRIPIVLVGPEVWPCGIIKPTGQSASALRGWSGIRIVRPVFLLVNNLPLLLAQLLLARLDK
jgi:hypothetical protein